MGNFPSTTKNNYWIHGPDRCTDVELTLSMELGSFGAVPNPLSALGIYFLISQKTPVIEGSLNSKLPTIWRVEKQMKSR